MKKIIFALVALATVAMVSCGKDDDKKKDEATLTVTAPTQTVAVTPATLQTPVAVNVESSEGIEKMLVTITSTSAAFNGTLTQLDLNGEFDLLALGAAQSGALAQAGVTLPTKGAKSWNFVLTPFLSMMYGVDTTSGGTGVFTAKFDVKAVDAKNNSKSATVNLDFKAQ